MKIKQKAQIVNKDKTSQLQIANKDVPDHWKIVKLGDVLREVNVRAKDLNIFETEQVPVMSLTKNKGLIPQNERFINRVATQDISNYKVIKKGQIVYNPFVLWEGAIYALKGRELGLTSPVYLVWEATNAEHSFLDFLLRTPQLLNEYLRVASGVVQRRRAVRKDVFLNIKIPLPPPSEQHAIVQALQTIQDTIQTLRNELALERECKAVLMQRLFTSGINNVSLKHTLIGEIPESWKVAYLRDIIQGTPQNGAFIKQPIMGKGTKYVNVYDIYQGTIINFKAVERMECESSYLVRYALKESDMLFVRSSLKREGVGHCCLVRDMEESAIYDCHLIKVSPNTKVVEPLFLTYFYLSELGRNNLVAHSKTTTMTTINQNTLLDSQIPIPPLTEQRDIMHILEAYDSKIDSLYQEISLVEELFGALIEELITGRLSTIALIQAEQAS